MSKPRDILRTYLGDCHVLLEGLQEMLDDIEFRLRGGEVRYAIDFAEIFSYIVPESRSRFFNVFSYDMDEQENISLERLILRSLFYEATRNSDATLAPHILLPPYLTELENFTKHLSQQDFDSIIRSAIKAFELEARVLNDDANFRIIFAMKTKDTDYQLTEEERIKLNNLVADQDHVFAKLLSPPSQQTRLEIKRLFEAGVFAGLDTLVKFHFDFDDPLLEQIYDRLFKLRTNTPQGATRFDAIAMTVVEQANNYLQESNPQVRLCLVSRSYHMRKIYRERRYINENRLKPLLRHPRMFNMISIIKNRQLSDQRDEIKDRIRKVQGFVMAAKDALSLSETDDLDMELYDELLRSIRKDWILKESAVAAKSELITPHIDLFASGLSQQARDFIYILKNYNSVKNIVLEQLQSLYTVSDARLNTDQALLGFAFQGSYQNTLSELNIDDKNTNFIMLHANPSVMPYSAEFYSEAARRLITVLSDHKDLGWYNLILFFREVFQGEPEFERWFLMAYILGAMNKWELAESYCKQALLVNRVANVPQFEAKLLFALCLRKSKRNFDRHLQALKYINWGIEERYKYFGNQINDARYLKEKGTHILIMHMYHQANVTVNIPTDEEGLKLLHQAKELCKDDDLYYQIINNILDYEIERKLMTGLLHNHDQLKVFYNELVKQQNEIHKHVRDWKPSRLDTIAISKWILFEVDEDTKIELLQWIDYALTDRLLSEQEKERIKRHRKLIIEKKYNY